ncbi:MAG: hypothetical protein ACLSGQ_13670 [Parabacteroides distasonis]
MGAQNTDKNQHIEGIVKYKFEILGSIIAVCSGFFVAGIYVSNLLNKLENNNIIVQEVKERQAKDIDNIKDDIKELKVELKDTQNDLKELQKEYYHSNKATK